MYRLSRILMTVTAILLIGGLIGGAGQAAEKTFFRITTANIAGVFYPGGQVIASLLNDNLGTEGLVASAQASSGTAENIHMMAAGEAEGALLGLTIMSEAYSGTGAFEGKPHKDVRMITTVWPNVVQMVVTEKSGVRTYPELKGKRVCVGTGSIEPVTAIALEGVDMTFADVIPEYLGFAQATDAIKAGRLAGAMVSGGMPQPSVMDLFASRIGVRILGMTEEQIKRINEQYPTYVEYTIEPNTYQGQDYPVRTVASMIGFGVRKDIPEDLVYRITKTIFENVDYLHNSLDALKYVSLERAIPGITVPLHPGAIRYYVERGLTIPERLIPEEYKG